MKPIQIIVISDNHYEKEPVFRIRERYSEADYFFHLGDSEMPPYELHGYACVRGNNDFYEGIPERLVLDIGNHRFLLTHGHRDFSFRNYEMLAHRAKAMHCDVVCFGHTHIYLDEEIEGVRLLNPGSIWHNRDNTPPSYMILTIDEKGDIVAKRCQYDG